MRLIGPYSNSGSTKMEQQIHIADIDLPVSVFHIDNLDQAQTIDYLNYKQEIADKFNI
jgi:adenylate cyclase class 1